MEPSCPQLDALHRCSLCSKQMIKKSLLRHMRTQHPEALATTLSCAFCPAQLVDSVQLQLHTATCPGMARADAPASRAQADGPDQQLALVPVAVLPRPEVVRSASEPFLAWLGESPVYEMERQVKSTLLITDTQLRQPSTDLRFLMHAAGTTELRALIEPATVQRILDSLLANGKGPDRVYQLTLLLRKVLIFLFVQQSKASLAVVSPALHASWAILDRQAHQSGRKRKLQQRNRMVLGDADDDQAIMTLDEMAIVQRGCLAAMDRLESVHSGYLPPAAALEWQRLFVTLLFIQLIGPRSQTMASLSTETVLRPGAVGNSSNDQWQVRIPAELNKAGQPVLLDVPAPLTARMDVLFTRVLKAGHQGALFLTRSGAVRTDYTDFTGPTTTQFLGRPINPHKFRSSVVTAVYGRADVDAALLRGAADIMTHTPAVQQQFYVKQKRLKNGAALQRILSEGVGAAVE